MKRGIDLAGRGFSVRTLMLGVVTIAAVAVAVTMYVRSGDPSDVAVADSLAAPSAAPPTAGYIKIGDIKGESTDKAHSEWINLLSVSQSISRPMSSGATGSTRQRSSATFGDVVVVKELDKSSTKLQESIAGGGVIGEVTLDLVRTSAEGSSEPYMQYVLTNVVITNYRLSGSVAGDDRPTETFSLNFEKIKVVYNVQDERGASAGSTEFNWDIAAATAQ